MSAGTIVQVLTSGDAGGGQNVSLRISKALAERGWTIRFATPSTGDFTRAAASVGEVDVIPENSLRDVPRVSRVRRYVKDVNASLVHTHTPVAASMLWRFGAYLSHVPVVHHVHTPNFYGRGLKSKAAHRLDAATANLANRFIAVSNNTAAGVIADGYPRAKVTVCYNPLPWQQRERIAAQKDTAPVIACIGRVSRMKGQLELVEGFASICGKYPGAELWIVGPVQRDEADYSTALDRRSRELGVFDVVKRMGHRDDVRELLSRVTVLALPSHVEAFPLVVLEAMSVGVPVVATKVGGIGELITDGVNGILIDAGSVEQLSTALDRLLESESLRERLSLSGYDTAWSRFDEASTLDPIVSIIEEEAARAHRN